MKSRLNENIKKRNIRTLIIIIAIIAAMAIFGTQLLVGFGVVLNNLKGDDASTVDIQSVDYIAPPVLNPLPSATNKDIVSITGSSTSKKTLVVLYVNGKILDDATTDDEGEFSFYDIFLNKGNNEIKARLEPSVVKKSTYSNSLNIKYIGKEPTLEINFPQNDQKFHKDESPIKITGKSDPGVKVTINGFWTIINDSGDFYYIYTLKDGDNSLKITATDEAGNKTEKEIKIKVE